ncbi:MAG: Uma2 family endonuclease, partial [Gammaproteobacteria bacterium]
MLSSVHSSYRRYRLTADNYHRMAKAGIFAEEDRVELIEGEIIEMAPIGSQHAAYVARLQKLLERSAG